MKRFHLNLDLTGVIVLIAAGVLLPVLLATAVGIVALVIADDAGGIVTGVLVICFAVTATGSAAITVVLAGRKARLARRQADFVANVSHEFRTPLSAIRLYTQTLQSGKLADRPGETAQCLDTILRETEWLDMMIDKVLSWRASSKDRMPLTMKTQPVEAAVNSALERFRALVAPEDILLNISIETRQAVRHDPEALSAVILNLLTNAFKYTERDKNIEVRVQDSEGDVHIEIKDNGRGISPAEQKKIFQPFYRAGETRTGDTTGVGLGLAIVGYLVHRHGGTIDVESEEGKGSMFTVRLPATETS